jgi:hypothetical protein
VGESGGCERAQRPDPGSFAKSRCLATARVNNVLVCEVKNLKVRVERKLTLARVLESEFVIVCFASSSQTW